MGILKKIFSKSRSPEGGIFFETISKMIGFNPITLDFYKTAFTHRSINKLDAKGQAISYERLEFLGDAMLSSVIAAFLYNEVPTGDEGYLTKMRSKIVSREHLNELGRDLNLIQFVESKVSHPLRLQKYFHECFRQNVDISRLEGKVISYKSLIIEWCQKEKKTFNFDVFEDNGISGERLFGVKLSIDSKIVAKARATSKKKAEEKASQRAYFALQEKMDEK